MIDVMDPRDDLYHEDHPPTIVALTEPTGPNGLHRIVVRDRYGRRRGLGETYPKLDEDYSAEYSAPETPTPEVAEWEAWTRAAAALVRDGLPLRTPMPTTSTAPRRIRRAPRAVPPPLPEGLTPEWLRARRDDLGWSQRELAAAAGVSRSAVAQAECPTPRKGRQTGGVSGELRRTLARALTTPRASALDTEAAGD